MRRRAVVVALGGVWALAWVLTLASLDRDIVIVPFYVAAAEDAGALPVVTRLPAWTRAAPQPEPALQPGDAVVRVGDAAMQGAGVLRVVSHAWVAMGEDGVVPLEVERDGARRATAVAIPRTIPKWPVVVVSLVFGVFALGAALRFGQLPIAALAFLPMILQALWLGTHFGRTPTEMLAATALRGLAVAAVIPASIGFFRHFPDGCDDAVRWARGWPWLLALQGVFFFDAELFGRLPGPLLELGPKLITAVAAGLYLTLGTLNYRHATPAGRRRFKWLLIGAYVAALPPTFVSALSAVRPELGAWFLPSQLAQLAIPAAIAMGLWRRELFDVDRLWNATLVWLTAAAGVGLGLVLGVPAWTAWLVERGLSPDTAGILGAGGLLVVAAPAALVVQTRLDRWVLADRRAREGRAAALQHALASARKLEEVATRLAEGLPDVLEAERAAVYADLGDGFGLVAAEPVAGAGPAPPAGGALLRALAAARGPVLGDALRAPAGGWHPDERGLAQPGAALVPIRATRPGAAGRLAAFAVVGPRRDGLPHAPDVRPLLAALGAEAGALLAAFAHDATLREARALHRELDRRREETEQRSREKTSLLAAASHDLRQPLHALGLFLGALEDRLEDPQGRALLDRARSSARAMQQMFESLLDVSQIDAGVLAPRIEDELPLAPLLDDVARDLAPDAARRGLDLRVHPTALSVRSDPALLRAIVQNLAGNALRFTERGGILLGARRRGERVRIEVWDTGSGIPSEMQQRLFGEWRRGGGAPRGREAGDGGFGLGLTIVQRLSQVLGHELDLASRPGRGSVFSVSVERGRPAPATSARGAPAEDAPPRRHFAGRRVLVVDDDADARAGLAALLTGWGIAVREAADPSGARRAVAAEPVDALLVDLDLGPGAHGLDVVDALPDTPACVVSGAGAPALEKARQRGLLVLRKPVEPVRLRAALEHLLRL